MQLIGMLDSPYVRRTAISLRMLGVGFEHRPLSVFRHFDEFAKTNPLVKAPTLVCDDGTVLVDSGLIIACAESLAGRSLWPVDPSLHRRALRLTGVALVVAEKAVATYYEERREPGRRDPGWTARVGGQLEAACSVLEAELAQSPDGAWTCGAAPLQPDITTAVAWRFAQDVAAAIVPAAGFPRLAALGARAEALPEFLALPFD